MHPEPTGAHLSLLGCPASPELLQSLGRADSPLLQILLQVWAGDGGGLSCSGEFWAWARSLNSFGRTLVTEIPKGRGCWLFFPEASTLPPVLCQASSTLVREQEYNSWFGSSSHPGWFLGYCLHQHSGHWQPLLSSNISQQVSRVSRFAWPSQVYI